MAKAKSFDVLTTSLIDEHRGLLITRQPHGCFHAKMEYLDMLQHIEHILEVIGQQAVGGMVQITIATILTGPNDKGPDEPVTPQPKAPTDVKPTA